jgi:hypothetical protein
MLLPIYILIKQRRLKNNLLPAGKIGFASTYSHFADRRHRREQRMSGSNA